MKQSEKHLTKLAERFARKISLSQIASAQSAQPEDIEQTLKSADVFPQPKKIAPLLNAAKCPDDVSIKVDITVDTKLNVIFQVTSTPPNPCAISLQKLLQDKYAAKMSNALRTAKISVSDNMTVGIANFVAN